MSKLWIIFTLFCPTNANIFGQTAITVWLLDPPDLLLHISNDAVCENDELSLSCFANDGNPDNITDVKWSFTSEFGHDYDFDCKSTSGNTYHIPNVSYSDTGNYSCSATHTTGPVTSQQKAVRVSCKFFSIFNLFLFCGAYHFSISDLVPGKFNYS